MVLLPPAAPFALAAALLGAVLLGVVTRGKGAVIGLPIGLGSAVAVVMGTVYLDAHGVTDSLFRALVVALLAAIALLLVYVAVRLRRQRSAAQ
jgi:hypothetical protein